MNFMSNRKKNQFINLIIKKRATLATAVDDVIVVHILYLESGTPSLVDSKQSIYRQPRRLYIFRSLPAIV